MNGKQGILPQTRLRNAGKDRIRSTGGMDRKIGEGLPPLDFFQSSPPGKIPYFVPKYLSETEQEGKLFRIAIADSPERRDQAHRLVQSRYEWRGYPCSDLFREDTHRITLIATGQDNEAIGTVTIGMEPELLAEGNYRREVGSLRARGGKICEFNGLAVSPGVRSKSVLARLFHTAMLCSFGLFGYTDGVVEVTPAHARFYARMLGFNPVGGPRVCPRVNTVGVLLHIDFTWSNDRIETLGGLGDQAKGNRTLYPYSFGMFEATEILKRLGQSFRSSVLCPGEMQSYLGFPQPRVDRNFGSACPVA